jgi:hypothetical protein
VSVGFVSLVVPKRKDKEMGELEDSMNRHPAGKKDDVVNHPGHYTKFSVEVIDITENLDFLSGNIVKYVVRAPFKGEQLQDLRKAQWYLNRLISKVERNTK